MREEPQPIPPGVVESLIRASDPQAIRVTAGPFADVVGQLERLDDNGRVKVLLELMGGKVRVALPEALVAPNRGSA